MGTKGYTVQTGSHGLTYITFDHFTATGLVTHGFSLRQGGVSLGHCSQLNMGYKAGDDPAHVRINRQRFSDILGLSSDTWVCGCQTHTDRIQLVTAADSGKGAHAFETGLPDTDGLVTNEPGVTLAAFFADCIPVMLLDPVTKGIGVVHAGWKGTAQGIAAKAAVFMRDAFGTDVCNLLASIGPGIGSCCYEVDERVVQYFLNQPDMHRYIIATEPGKWQMDLLGINRHQLMSVGVPESAITTMDLCTSCYPELFFSHRGQGGKTGRMAAVISLRRE